MSNYSATISWQRGADRFIDRQYSRAHTWSFDGGASIPASATPEIVPAPWCDPAAVDPEEAFIASLASCHMLFFLDLACRAGHVVESYQDEATGVLEKNAQGRMMMSQVTLHPRVQLSESSEASAEDLEALHEKAHELCFIANSVISEVRVEPLAAPLEV